MSIPESVPPSGGSWLRDDATGELTPLELPGAAIDAEAVLAEALSPETPAAPAGETAEEE